MSNRLSPRPGPLLAAVAVLIATPAAAQLGGGPPNPEIGARMRGVPQPPFPAAVDKLPTPLLKLPRGFRAEVSPAFLAREDRALLAALAGILTQWGIETEAAMEQIGSGG